MRFLAPVVLTALLVALATRESSLPFVAGRYSFVFAGVLLATAGLAAVGWVTAAREQSARPVVANLALLLASAVLSVYGLEATFRFGLLESKIPRNAAEFDAWIARDWPEPRTPARTPGRLRILGISDSFGRAMGADNYHYVLEDALRETGLDVEVVNLSITGISPVEQLELLDRYGETFAPDLVLHGIYTGNDLRILPGRLRHFRRILIREHAGWASLHPSHLTWIQAADGLARVLANSRQLRAEGGAGTFSRANFLRLGAVQLASYAKAADADAVFSHGRTALGQIQRRTQDLGARYAALVLPERLQVETALRDEVMSRFNLDTRDYAFDLTQRIVLEDCRTASIACLDLLPVFREHAAGGGYFLPEDEHLNTAGNRLVAEAAAPFVHSLLSGSRRPASGARATAAAEPRAAPPSRRSRPSGSGTARPARPRP